MFSQTLTIANNVQLCTYLNETLERLRPTLPLDVSAPEPEPAPQIVPVLDPSSPQGASSGTPSSSSSGTSSASSSSTASGSSFSSTSSGSSSTSSGSSSSSSSASSSSSIYDCSAYSEDTAPFTVKSYLPILSGTHLTLENLNLSFATLEPFSIAPDAKLTISGGTYTSSLGCIVEIPNPYDGRIQLRSGTFVYSDESRSPSSTVIPSPVCVAPRGELTEDEAFTLARSAIPAGAVFLDVSTSELSRIETVVIGDDASNKKTSLNHVFYLNSRRISVATPGRGETPTPEPSPTPASSVDNPNTSVNLHPRLLSALLALATVVFLTTFSRGLRHQNR